VKSFVSLIRRYIYDILSAVFGLGLAYVSITFIPDPQKALVYSSIIIFASLTIIIYLRQREKDFYFIPFTKRSNKDNWMGFGNFEYDKSQNCFSVTDAEPGYIYSRCLTWSDYKFDIEFKIINTCIGVLVRAVNLSNNIMLQITLNGIRPHIRLNGGWSIWESKDAGLSFQNNLSLDNWYRGHFFCEGNTITIKLYEKKEIIFDRSWEIPRGRISFEFKRSENDDNPVKIPFPINLEYGTVGFRNYKKETALVKNVFIEKL
jgi:hypothetical protein